MTTQEDDRRLVTRASIARAAAALDPTARLAPAAEDAVMDLVAQFVGDALTAGAAVARRRRSSTLTPGDVGPYLARAWHVHVPGAGADGVVSTAAGGVPGAGHPRRPAASDLHRARMAAVRRAREAAAAAEALAAGGGGGAGAANGGGPTGGGGGSAKRGR